MSCDHGVDHASYCENNKSNNDSRDEIRVANIVEAKHPRTKLVFLFRQRDSYMVAKSMYPGVDIRLVPDAAFMIGPLVRVGSEKFKYDILFLARVDKESEGGPADGCRARRARSCKNTACRGGILEKLLNLNGCNA
eukprot:jgi/Undpi1/7877/HiC_scaffold_24.g10349.m1